MDWALTAARLVLAGALATAAAGKLADLPGSRRALVDFGLPRRAGAAAGVLLPAIEFALAAALLFPASTRPAAATAAGLLVAFSAGIANAMAHGRAPDCHCFGRLHSAPAGPGALARNAGLAALAACVAGWGPGPSIWAWLSTSGGLAIAAAVLGVAALGEVSRSRVARRDRAPERAPGSV